MSVEYDFEVPLYEIVGYGTNGAYSKEIDTIAFDVYSVWKWRTEETPDPINNLNLTIEVFIRDFVWIIQHEHIHRLLNLLEEHEADKCLDYLHLTGWAI